MEFLSHVIGTGALLTFMILICASFTSLAQMETFDLVKRQLKEIADDVSSKIMYLIVLANSSEAKNLFFYQRLEVPYSVSSYGYSIKIEKIGGIFNVVAKLDRFSTIYAESSLPLNGTTLSIRLVTEEGQAWGPGILSTSQLPSGYSKSVIWCKKQDGIVYIGLGRLQG
jgi:hypothetical protein